MPQPRRHRNRTLAIRVDSTTARILTEEANAHFGGDVSALVAALAREARRTSAVERIAKWSGYARLSDAERSAIEAGIHAELAAQRS